MLYDICFLFFLFISYSVMGCIIECIACSIEWKKPIYDRGFLIGPYCPIYGWGGILVYLILTKYENDPITLFVLAAVGASVLEYITSFFMEKLFKARWWDYSNRKFNIEGRICLGNAVLFGLLGMAFIYLVNPFYLGIMNKIPNNILIIISSVLFILFLIDNILSFTIITKLKLNFVNIRKDATAEVDKQVKEFLSSYNFFIKRIFRAFPKIKISLPKGDYIEKAIKDILNNIEKAKKKRKREKKKLKK